MQDRPAPIELVKSVTNLLQSTILPALSGRAAFEIRVAINALDLVARELAQADEGHANELHRLENLLGQGGTVSDLNAELCARIANGAIDMTDAGLVDHLWKTTLEKLSVDQPSYAAFRDELRRDELKKDHLPENAKG
jgi:hypothetical protein